MPAKKTGERAKAAKRRGTTMTTKAEAKGKSRHAAKKSATNVKQQGFESRAVSERAEPGFGKTRQSAKLPLPDRAGSSTNRRKTLPAAVASRFRKSGRDSHPPLASS